jgi:hypothetical protein
MIIVVFVAAQKMIAKSLELLWKRGWVWMEDERVLKPCEKLVSGFVEKRNVDDV